MEIRMHPNILFTVVYTYFIFLCYSFQVDRAGISIVGVGIYGGIGHYEYEVELLEDVSENEPRVRC